MNYINLVSTRYGISFLKSNGNTDNILLQPQEFWKTIANSTVEWMKPFTNVMDCDMSQGKFQWFSDGQLNASGSFKIFFILQSPQK